MALNLNWKHRGDYAALVSNQLRRFEGASSDQSIKNQTVDARTDVAKSGPAFAGATTGAELHFLQAAAEVMSAVLISW